MKKKVQIQLGLSASHLKIKPQLMVNKRTNKQSTLIIKTWEIRKGRNF